MEMVGQLCMEINTIGLLSPPQWLHLRPPMLLLRKKHRPKGRHLSRNVHLERGPIRVTVASSGHSYPVRKRFPKRFRSIRHRVGGKGALALSQRDSLSIFLCDVIKVFHAAGASRWRLQQELQKARVLKPKAECLCRNLGLAFARRASTTHRFRHTPPQATMATSFYKCIYQPQFGARKVCVAWRCGDKARLHEK